MKKIEIAVKQIVSGKDVVPSGTVANPDSLKLYYKYRDIEQLSKSLVYNCIAKKDCLIKHVHDVRSSIHNDVYKYNVQQSQT